MNTLLFTTLGAVFPLFNGAIFWVAPRVRHGSFFDVTVSEEWARSVEAGRTLRVYRARVAALTPLDIAITCLGFYSGQALPVVLGTVVFLAGALLAFADARAKTRPHAVAGPRLRTASLRVTRETMPGGVFAVLVPFAMLALTAWFLEAHWSQIPLRWATHWDLRGRPNGFSERSFRGVYGILLFAGTLAGVMYAMAWAMLRGAPRGSDGNAPLRHANLRALIGMTWGLTFLFCTIALRPVLRSAYGWTIPVAAMPLAVLVLLAVLLLPAMSLSARGGGGGDATPDAAWKLGYFYYNPEDPAVMVPRRSGMQYTMNFGRWQAWLFTMVALSVPAIGLLLLRGAR